MEVHTIHFDTLNSTNTWLKQHARSLSQTKITCVIAATQTAGRGTYDKRWVSEKGNLLMSLFFCLNPNHPLLPHMAQLFAYSSAQVLLSKQIPVKIKWPNDLFVNGKKLSGVLAETIQLDQLIGVVIGIGMNVNTPVETNQATISLLELTKYHWELDSLAQEIVQQFQQDLKLDVSTFTQKLLLGRDMTLKNTHVRDDH